MLEVQGKTAIVTGGASGIGLGIAKALAGAGMVRWARAWRRRWSVLTHAGERAAVKARHDRIEAAFDRAEIWEKTR